MEQEFYKYQGTGNDFILIDDRSLNFPEKDVSLVARLCDRRFGIGADGLILIQNAATSDFKMVYFNADGNESTLCGNGARCFAIFVREKKLTDKEHILVETKKGIIMVPALFIKVTRASHQTSVDKPEKVSI